MLLFSSFWKNIFFRYFLPATKAELLSFAKSDKGQLETVGSKMGYPIGIFIQMVVKINNQSLFRHVLASQRYFNSFTNLLFMLHRRATRGEGGRRPPLSFFES